MSAAAAFWVACGGALGAAARYACVQAAARAFGPGFPVGTLLVNVAGSFAIGVAAALLLARPEAAAARWAPFLVPGLLGGFTTFSAFALDALTLAEGGRAPAALAYVVGSVAASVAAAAAGLWLARSLL